MEDSRPWFQEKYTLVRTYSVVQTYIHDPVTTPVLRCDSLGPRRLRPDCPLRERAAEVWHQIQYCMKKPG